VSQFILNKVATPSTPATNKVAIFYDTADGKVKCIDQTGVVSAVQLDGWRDRPILFNGSFEFWQRQVPATVTTYSSVGGRVYCADRWWTSNENASITAARIDTESSKETGLGTRYYGQFAKLTTTGKFMVGQTLGATTIMNMRGSKVRVQFLIKASQALTIRMGLIQLAAAGTVDTVPINAGTFVTAWGANSTDPTLGSNLAYITPDANSADGGTISGNGMSCSAGTTWARYSCTFTPPNDCHDLSIAVWTDSQFTAGQSLSIAEVGIYDGPEVRTNFVPYPSILEQQRLHKYYQKSFPLGTAPAASLTVAAAGNGATSLIGKAGATALAVHIPITFQIRMRAAPTVTLYTPVAAGAVPYRIDGTTPAVQTAVAQTGLTDFGLVVTATGDAAGTVGDLVGVHWTAESEL
jgi:hypothetical protein